MCIPSIVIISLMLYGVNMRHHSSCTATGLHAQSDNHIRLKSCSTAQRFLILQMTFVPFFDNPKPFGRKIFAQAQATIMMHCCRSCRAVASMREGVCQFHCQQAFSAHQRRQQLLPVSQHDHTATHGCNPTRPSRFRKSKAGAISCLSSSCCKRW